MKKYILLIVIMFAFGMNANAQDIAMVDNSNNSTIEKYSDNDNISPEIKKLKAEFLKEIKQQYFINRG